MDIRALVSDAADRYGIPQNILHGVAHAESSYNPDALSPRGAQGVMQLMPDTARDLGVNPHDPAQNVDGGARYLKAQYDRFGSWPLAAAAYNAGPGAVEKHGGVPPYAETQAYVRKVTGGQTASASTPSADDLQSYFGGHPDATHAQPPAHAPSVSAELVDHPEKGVVDAYYEPGSGGKTPSSADLQAYFGAGAAPAIPATPAVSEPKSAAERGAYDYSRQSLSGLSPASRFTSGIGATLLKAIPGADEAGAGLGVLSDMLSGRSTSAPQSWMQQRALQRAETDDFAARHPNISGLTTGAGWALQAAPAFLTGGASAVPTLEAAAAKNGLVAGAQRLGANVAKAGVTGGLSGEVNGLASDGSLQQRLQAGQDDAITSGLVSAGIPLAGAAAGLVGRGLSPIAKPIARTVNRVTGGKLLDPQTEAMSRLTASLKADGATADQVQAIVTDWQKVGGPSPAMIDVVSRLPSGGQATMGLMRGAAMTGPARGIATKYGDAVAADLQGNAIARTQALTPHTHTIPDVEAGVAQRIASNTVAPDVQAGSGGAGVSDALNSRFDTAQARVSDAYRAARAAEPDRAQVPRAEIPQLAQHLRESVSDFHPADVPGVTRILSGLDNMGTLNVRDLFETRARLSNLRAGPPSVEGSAAGTAVRALDSRIDDIANRNGFEGDPGVVGLWHDAIQARRDMGRAFQGSDMTQTLTERELHGDARTRAVAPEDATSVMIGRNGVLPRQDTVRDLTRIRDTLGASSPEWAQFQREAQSRLLGRDAGTEQYGTAWQGFERQNPELAQLLMPEADRAALTRSQGVVQGAVAERGALNTGAGILNASPDRYAADVAGATGLLPVAQVGAARSIEDAVGRPTEGSTGLLNRLANATNTGRNLGTTFGQQPTADYRQSVQNMIDQVNNARYINPNTNSQTAGRLFDAALVDVPNIPMSKTGLVMAALRKLTSGAAMTDQEKAALVELATSKAGDRALPIGKGAPGRKTGARLSPHASGAVSESARERRAQ